MRSRHLGFLFSLWLVASLTVSPFACAEDLPRHVDPAELEEENPLPSALFLLYQSIFDSIASEDYAYSLKLLAWLGEVYAPPQTLSIMLGLNEQIVEAVLELNQTSFHIDEAFEFLRWLREKEAEYAIERALYYLALANVTVGGIEATSVQLSSSLKVPSAPLTEGLEKVRLLIQSYLARIRELGAGAVVARLMRGEEVGEGELEGLLALARDFYPELEGETVQELIECYRENPLVSTLLLIQADRCEALVGTDLTINGVLFTSEGEGLGFKVVDLLLDGTLLERLVTDPDGSFKTVVKVPYVYRDSVTFQAEYWPKDADRGVYAPSVSDRIVLYLVYYRPVLKVTGPSSAYPGKEASFNGALTFGGEPLQGFDVIVAGFEEVLGAVTGADGGFSVDLPIPVDAPEGPDNVKFEAFPREEFGPAEAELSVEVVRLLSELWLGAPSWIISGNRLRVEGIVTVGLQPLKGCRVTVRNGDNVAVVTSQGDGSFKVSLDLPLVMFTARYPYSLKASPVEAWIEPVTVSRSVFVVNVFTLVGAPVFLGVALVYTVKRVERRPSQGREEQLEGEVEAVGLGAEAPVEEKPETFPAIYLRAVELVFGFTGVLQSPSQTIREYLQVIRGSLVEGGYAIFEGLSLMYEGWLYGLPVEPDLGEASRLLDELGRLLGHKG